MVERKGIKLDHKCKVIDGVFNGIEGVARGLSYSGDIENRLLKVDITINDDNIIKVPIEHVFQESVSNFVKDELVQYYIVNKDLIKEYNMSPGEIAAQVAHVATIIALKNRNSLKFNDWLDEGQKKDILGGHKKDLEKLVDMGFDYIKDNGLIEIPPDSLTVVGLGVMWRSDAQQYIKRLQKL